MRDKPINFWPLTLNPPPKVLPEHIRFPSIPFPLLPHTHTHKESRHSIRTSQPSLWPKPVLAFSCLQYFSIEQMSSKAGSSHKWRHVWYSSCIKPSTEVWFSVSPIVRWELQSLCTFCSKSVELSGHIQHDQLFFFFLLLFVCFVLFFLPYACVWADLCWWAVFMVHLALSPPLLLLPSVLVPIISGQKVTGTGLCRSHYHSRQWQSMHIVKAEGGLLAH